MRRLALVLVCAIALPVSTARAWTWPVDGPVLRPFVFDHDSPYAAGQHRGIDIGASPETPVLAPAEGVVSFAGTVPTGGKTISIQTPYGYTATLLHLGSIGVKRGAVVREGAVVGAAGAEAGAEPYVYFGVRTTSEPQGYVDPLSVLPAAPAVPAAAPAPAVQAPALSAAPAEPASSPGAAETTVEAPPETVAADEVAASEPVETGEGMTVTAQSSGRRVIQQSTRHARATRVASRPSVARRVQVDAHAVSDGPERELRARVATDADVGRPTVLREDTTSHSSSRIPLPLIGALLAACAFVLVIRYARLRRAARIMSSPEPELSVVR